MKQKSWIPAVLVLLVVLFTQCKREEPTSWDPHILGPVAFGRVTLADIVTDSLLSADQNGLWHLIFHENLTDFEIDSLVEIPDTLIEKVFDVPLLGGPFTLPNGTALIDEEENNLINVNDAQLKEVIMKSGKLRYKLKSYINGYLACVYDLPGVTYNGVGTVIQTTTLPSVGEIPFVYEGEIDLADYHLDMTGISGFSSNRIYSHLTIATSVDSPQQAVVYGDDYVTIELEFIDPVVYYARGYFGQHNYDLDQTIEFGEDFNMPTGALNLNGTTMSLHVENNVGADLELDFSELVAQNSYNSSSVYLNHASLFEPIHLTRAFDNNGVVTPDVYDVTLNAQNSNIDDFIENLPDALHMIANVKINPLGDVSDGADFIYTENALNAEMEIDIPLNIGMSNLTLRDTLVIAEDLELTADGKFVLYVTNTFPFSATLNAYFSAEGNTSNISFVSEQTIAAASETGIAGQTVAAHSMLIIPASQSIIDVFNPENSLVIEVVFNTPEYPQLVGLYQNYYMDFKLVADGEVQVEFR
ncbi:MAG: hypothetical protein ACKVOK_13825 [Flavobacteriales bacterium]